MVSCLRFLPMMCLLVVCHGATSLLAVDLVNEQTPWRAFFVQGLQVSREKGQLTIADGRGAVAFDPQQPETHASKMSPLPAPEWASPNFNDRAWPRYGMAELNDFIGDYGVAVPGRSWPAQLCLRAHFAVADPANAGELQLTVRYIGGAVVFINGKEIGRAHLPEGPLADYAIATDYDETAYTSDGTTPLPGITWTTPVEPKLEKLYATRIRELSIKIPANTLVKGRNTVAVRLYRSAVAGKLPPRNPWSHLGINSVAITSDTDAGVTPYSELVKGTHLWNADTIEPVTSNPAAKSLVKRSWFHAINSARGLPRRGTHIGNPLDGLEPVRMAAPRNGVVSGQVVLSDLAGLRKVTARMSELKGPEGATIPSTNIQIRYAIQQGRMPVCDALLERAPENASTVPIWMIVQVPKDARTGWYAGKLEIQGNGKQFTATVQLLVTGLILPDAKDFTSSISLNQSPESLALMYEIEPFSDAHFKLLDRSYALMGQVGNDVLHVAAILSTPTPVARNWTGPGSDDRPSRAMPFLRWKKTEKGLEPDLTLFEKLLDTYSKHCAAPAALSIYMWDAAIVTEIADAYESRRIASKDNEPKSPILVHVVDAKTGEVSEHQAPAFTADEAEAFWKPMLDAVHASVKKRGWNERCILISLGGDLRPGSKTAERFRKWAPYARWNLLSHFSGDPGPENGKFMATGDLEIGMREAPDNAPLSTARLEELLENPPEYLDMPTIRWEHQETSPPHMYRTMPLLRNNLTRLGLDFYSAGMREYPNSTSWFSHVNQLSFHGDEGALPTVRFQLLREGVQDTEIRTLLMKQYLKLPEEKRQPFRAILDNLVRRIAYGGSYLSGTELQYDWPAYVAQLQQAAAEISGHKNDATWSSPPKPEGK